MKRLAFCVALLAPLEVHASMMTTGVTSTFTAVENYAGPGDVVSFNVWGGLRAYSRADCTGSVAAVRIRRASDNVETDINILANCDLDVASVTTHCAATTCFVRTLYNRGSAGATHNYVQATAGNQLSFVFNCNGARPCMSSGSSAIILASANAFTPTTGVVSLHYVGAQTVGTGGCAFINSNSATGNRLSSSGSGTNWGSAGGTSGSIVRAAAFGAFHVATPVINGASSALVIDGGTTTGTNTGSTTAGAPSGFRAATSTTCVGVEGGFVDAVVLSADQRQTLSAQARGYWGF